MGSARSKPNAVSGSIGAGPSSLGTRSRAWCHGGGTSRELGMRSAFSTRTR